MTLEELIEVGSNLRPRSIHKSTLKRLYTKWSKAGLNIDLSWGEYLQKHQDYWLPRYEEACKTKVPRVRIVWSYNPTNPTQYLYKAYIGNTSNPCKTVRPLKKGVSFRADLVSLLRKYAKTYNADFCPSSVTTMLPIKGTIVLYSLPCL